MSFVLNSSYIFAQIVFLTILGIGLEMLQMGREILVRSRQVVATGLLGVFGGLVIVDVPYLS